MSRRGGYQRSTDDEWMKTSQLRYAEAVTSAHAMGQDPVTWLSDAIEHHAYRCEVMLANERFAEASREAADRMQPTPLKSDYLPTRPAPTITRTAGQGSGPNRRQHRP